ncbi:MAG: mechanosensitive ion channel domain-containing protein, partial [Planctomycetota bacterium]
RIKRLLAHLAVPARRKGSLDFRSTAAAVGVSLTAAFAAPLTLGWFAYVLTGGWAARGGTGDLPAAMDASAFGIAAAYAGAVWLPLSLLRTMTRRDGLADAHFEWPSGAVRRIQRQTRWFFPLILPAAGLAGLLGSSDPLHAGGGFERVAFTIACGLAALLIYRLLRPSGVVWESIHRVAPESPSYRMRLPLCAIATLGPLALGGLSVFGFHYTAGELARRGLETASLLAVVLMFRSAAVRWVTVSRRAMLYREMQRRREEAVAREQAGDASPSSGQTESPAGAPPTSETPSVSAAELSGQTRTLVTAIAFVVWACGLWFVWADVLPALNKLEDIRFASWTVRREVTTPDEPLIRMDEADRPAGDAAEPGADETRDAIDPADESPSPRIERVPISLWDLLVAAAAAGLTVLAARNLPALLALSVFDRLPLDAGGRYAVSRLAGYAAVVVGVLFTAGRLGFEWENVQWLVAALTVGLGFGLQEIVANFVCGAIILFERPVRVGDVVTVGDVTGVVSRIRIRATTITNWDRKEFIVPNKEFVTGRLLNWTLTDSTNRVVITVGVAYGSDTKKALELLMETAEEHPVVMSDPAPIATFEGFGDSSLTLLLRCYLPALDQRLAVITEMHGMIDAKFKAAGLEIAFPQRDLNIRQVPPEWASPRRSPSPARLAAGDDETPDQAIAA